MRFFLELCSKTGRKSSHSWTMEGTEEWDFSVFHAVSGQNSVFPMQGSSQEPDVSLGSESCSEVPVIEV